MTPFERLMAEAVPDGTFGGARTREPAQQPPAAYRPKRETTPLEAAEHVRQLEAALDEREGRGTGQPDRHLRAVPDPANRPGRSAA
ncbi:hypothetical protein ACWGCW_00595 [Streptomyces sp. NPDC054933]